MYFVIALEGNFFRCVRERAHSPALMMRKSRTVGVVQRNTEESLLETKDSTNA